MPAPKGHKAYAGCETGGRPKKYTQEFIEKEADAFLEWMKDPQSLWYEDFALQRGYDPNLLSLWAKENEKFSGVYRKAQAWQKSKLVKGGLLNEYNAGFTKFVMANTCGWTEKQETKVSGDAASPLQCIFERVDGNSKELLDDEEE